MLIIVWANMSKLFVAMLAAVGSVFAVGTVMAQQNNDQDEINSKLLKMSNDVMALTSRVESLHGRLETNGTSGVRA